MSKLIYITNTSLDGYIEDETGAFDWVNSDQVFDVHHRVVAADRNLSRLPAALRDDGVLGSCAEIAGLALQADLVDECQLFL